MRSKFDWENQIGRRLKLRDLHVFFTAVKHGSMGKAAKQLGISQPAVSEVIADLEHALGVHLLDRSPQGIEPTIYGSALLRRSITVFDELRQSVRDIEFLANPMVGEIRIGCPESHAFVSSAIIEKLSRSHPDVVVRVVTAQPATLKFRELRERQVDLLLGRVTAPLIDDDVKLEILIEDRLLVVAGAGNRWARRKKIELADLVSERWLLLPSNNVISALIAKAFAAHGLTTPRESVSADVNVRLHLLATGRFLTVFPQSLVHSVADRWSIKVLPVELGAQAPPVGIVTMKHRTLSPVVQLFIDAAREVAKSMTGKRALSRPPAQRCR
jgi:DNA-binding transcriptional LysR family regulator